MGRGIESEGYLDEEWLGETGDQDLTGTTRGKPARPGSLVEALEGVE